MGDLEKDEKESYMEQIEGFKDKGNENLVFQLKKRLYELKQTSKQWHK